MKGEAVGLDVGHVQFADGTVLAADAIIAAAGLATDATAIPFHGSIERAPLVARKSSTLKLVQLMLS